MNYSTKYKNIVKKNRKFFAFLIINSLILASFLLYRAPRADETIYLRDTLIIYRALESGENPFKYNVGLHGILFKVPVALAFFITGPSILVATLSNIVLGILSLILLYFLVKKHILQNPWALLTTSLLAFSYRFFGSGTTFLREMPA